MNLEFEGKSESSDKIVLSDIYKKDKNIAIWKRSFSKELLTSIDNFISSNKKDSTLPIIVKPNDVYDTLINELPDFALKSYLVEDISTIVDMFCYLFDLEQAGLRLATINKAMCPRFHVDRVPCRLISCYSGSTTEWLKNVDVNRSLLGISDTPFENKSTEIQRLDIGDVALLKGEAWEDNEGNGLIHRSPNILDNKTRLLLTLDFA
jgi:hypothetical protein